MNLGKGLRGNETGSHEWEEGKRVGGKSNQNALYTYEITKELA